MTNAISGIIIVGSMLELGGPSIADPEVWLSLLGIANRSHQRSRRIHRHRQNAGHVQKINATHNGGGLG